MQDRERGSVEARLATLRLGLFSVSAVIIAIIVGISALVFISVNNANEEYGLSAFLSDVSPVLIPTIVIIIVAALAINFGYTFYLRNQEASISSGEES